MVLLEKKNANKILQSNKIKENAEKITWNNYLPTEQDSFTYQIR